MLLEHLLVLLPLAVGTLAAPIKNRGILEVEARQLAPVTTISRDLTNDRRETLAIHTVTVAPTVAPVENARRDVASEPRQLPDTVTIAPTIAPVVTVPCDISNKRHRQLPDTVTISATIAPVTNVPRDIIDKRGDLVDTLTVAPTIASVENQARNDNTNESRRLRLPDTVTISPTIAPVTNLPRDVTY